ncbi:MAG: class I tRNA ligase family protein, partial [Candidatus Methanomethylicaceae archaeon]
MSEFILIMPPTIITAALPYSNDRLHLGHLRSTYLPSDVYARFLRRIGEDVIYVCATDEHGTPIALRAEKEGKT